MATIAFIGSDGSGKTTIIEKLQHNSNLPIKRIYLGLNLESSNYSLPTSRLILFVKLQFIKRRAKKDGITDPQYLTTHHIDHRKQKRSNLVVAVRSINRFAEAWFRQFISWYFQARGKIVVYDRHFLFDTAPNPSAKEPLQWADRMYRWIMTNIFPKSDLVLFLDAKPEILLQRKKEVSEDYLNMQRAAYLAQGELTDNFRRIDAAQPLDRVYSDVLKMINTLHLNKLD